MSIIMKNIVFPITQMRHPRDENIYTHLRMLRKTQWWTYSQLEQLQQKKLRALLEHAYENVPYYHKVFRELGLKPEDIKTTNDLTKLPLLTKEDIRNNIDKLVAKNYSKQKLIPYSTGGSTGEPMNFFVDKTALSWNMAAAYREWSWGGYNIGDKMAYLWGAPQDISHQTELKTKLVDLIRRRILLDAFNMTEKTLDKYAGILIKFKPTVINAYASAIYLMAQYVEKRGIEDIRPKAILTSCEMLFDYQRETVERAFGCEVFDYYSGRDTTLQAGECPEHSGYHLAIETGAIEFINGDEHVAPGELGKIVLTDLCNYAMPCIRYEIGDLGVPSDEICSCKRGLPLMEKVVGRVTDMITTREGTHIHGEFFTHLFYDTKGVKQFQFIQKTKDYAILKIIKEKGYSQAELDTIIRKIHKQCGDMKIDIEFVEFIPLTRSGKYRFTISDVEIAFP